MRSDTIWKFPLVVADRQEIEIPAGFQILTLQTQHDNPCMWVLVNPSAPKVKILFEIFGTGHPVPIHAERKYIGTFQLRNQLVFHCFQVLNH